MMEFVIVANGYGVQAVVSAENADEAWAAFCEEYEPASARSNYTVVTQAEHDSAEDFARRMNRRRQNGDLVGTVEVLDTMQADEEHEHEYDEWSSRYVGSSYERRYCVCGAFQARPIPDDPDDPNEGPTGIAGFLSQRSA